MSSAPPFAVHIEDHPLRLVVVGELDMATSGRLSEALAEVLARSSGPSVRLDVGGLTFMDSSGLAALLRVTEGGREVILCGAQAAIRRVLASTGLEDVITVEP